MSSRPIRVLVVDDSAFLRKGLSEMLRASPRIEVVGAARGGKDALEKVAELNPDVITLDLFMSEMDGVDFLKAQMARRPLPVVLVSSAEEAAEAAVAAMEAGAVEFVRKPTALALDQVYDIGAELLDKVITAASIPRERLPTPASDGGAGNAPVSPGDALPRPGDRLAGPLTDGKETTVSGRAHSPGSPARGLEAEIPAPGGRLAEVVVIGVSTGGPQALRYLLPRLPGSLGAAVAIVLHMPPGYTGPLAARLNELSEIEVLEAEEGLEMRPGRAILAQGGYHLTLGLSPQGVVSSHLDLSPYDMPHRPAVDVLFRSAAEIYRERTLGVVLTGMGNDGTAGSAWIKAAGGRILTEADETCVVYGMPRSVVEAGLSDRMVSIHHMPEIILGMVK